MPPRSKEPQPSFDFGFEPEPAETLGFATPTEVGPSDTFFFAIRPSPMAGARIDAMSQALISTPAWQGGHRVGLAQLHASLHALDRKAGALHDVLAAGCRAAAGLELKAFPVCFDALFQFKEGPIVLRGSDGVAPLVDLHRSLGLALRAAGFSVSLGSTPHISLIYPRTHAPVELPVIDPVSWTVDHLVLIHSRFGLTAHHELARWPLVA
ncbi:MAG: hypothetical protein EOP81_08270 [Variovorax sp.]|nr:MAG: hypothetical protein EOP81_08270 [Variovorax sp.]